MLLVLLIGGVAFFGVAVALYLFAAAATFDALVPYDPGVTRILSHAAYGAHPRQTVDVYAPQAGDRPLPLLVFFYGGGWDSGSRGAYGFAGTSFAAHGYIAVVADYRVHPEAVYPDFLADCAAAVAWARENAERIGGDAGRVVLAGHSAGAYNAAMLALDRRWLEAAGVPESAIVGWVGLAGPYNFLPLDDPATIRTFGHVDDLPKTQPITFASADGPPAFLATGDSDTTVSPRHTRQLAQRLRDAGVAVEERHYDGIGHTGLVAALARPLRWRAPVLEDATSFLRPVVGP